MIGRILVAVDDSPGGLAAARTAIMLAASLAAQLRAVHVLVDGDLDRALAAVHSGDTVVRRLVTALLDTKGRCPR